MKLALTKTTPGPKSSPATNRASITRVFGGTHDLSHSFTFLWVATFFWEALALMAYVIAEPCIGTKDTACVDACPVDCIHPRKDEPTFATDVQLYIDPVECIDCGACVPVCPVSAIFALDDLPEKWKHYVEINAKYYKR